VDEFFAISWYPLWLSFSNCDSTTLIVSARVQSNTKWCLQALFLYGSDGIKLGDALFYAIQSECFDIIELILEKDPQTSLQVLPGTTSPFEPGLTPFMMAAHKNNYKILALLYKWVFIKLYIYYLSSSLISFLREHMFYFLLNHSRTDKARQLTF